MAKLIGNLPSQIPTNADLGTMAYQDYDVVAPQFLAGRRNWIINGAMQVWQRGTSFSSINNGTYTADRFACQKTGTTDVTRVSCSVDGFNYALRQTAVAASSIKPIHLIEGHPAIHIGSTFTFSFWARANAAATYDVNGYNGTTSESWGFVDVTTEWQRFVLTKTLTVDGGVTAPYYRMHISKSQSAGSWLETTGWQFEVGSVATPFEHRSYGEELALCQRYYQKEDSSVAWLADMGFSGLYRVAIQFPTEMRTTPTVTSTVQASTGSSSGQQFLNPKGFTRFVNDPTTYQYVTSWTADAEL